MRLLPMHHVPQTCSWSVPTLLMPRPYWLSANDAPWSCWNDRQILVLTTTEICETCPVWKQRETDYPAPEQIPHQGAMAFQEP